MANCSISQDLLRNCEFQFGGLQKVYLANKADVVSVGYGSTGQVTGITMASGSTFHLYEFEPENASFTEEFQGEAISKSFLQTVSLTLAGQSQSTVVQLESLALSVLVAIVQTQDNRYWLVGEKGYGLRATSVNLNSGVAFTDNYINEIVLTGNNAGKANNVVASVVTGVI
jgi:hypothetical protein